MNYVVEGTGTPILLLHGWGASLLTFTRLSKSLSSQYKVYSISLPGFGESEIGVPLSVADIADVIRAFVLDQKIENPILLGHSYGTRVAAIYASKYPVQKLILVSAAGLKQKLKFSKRLKIRIYKIFKKCHLPVKMGSTDYQNADNVRRIMLVKAVNYDLSGAYKKIKVPTILIYGTKDSVTPLSLGYKIQKLIANSYLLEIEECGHFPYLERESVFTLILMSFLVGEDHAI